MSEVGVRPLRRVEFDLLVEHGVFAEEERIQLLEGKLVAFSPQGVPHARIVEALTLKLVPALEGRLCVRVQLPLAAGRTLRARARRGRCPVRRAAGPPP